MDYLAYHYSFVDAKITNIDEYKDNSVNYSTQGFTGEPIFMDDFIRHPHDHGSAWLGLGAAAACLVLFGASQFIIPTMLLILAALFVKYRRAKV